MPGTSGSRLLYHSFPAWPGDGVGRRVTHPALDGDVAVVPLHGRCPAHAASYLPGHGSVPGR